MKFRYGLALILSLSLPAANAQFDAPRGITLTASKSMVSAGGSVELRWSAAWADRCLANGAWLGVKANEGTEDVGPMLSGQKLGLTCFDGARRVAYAEVEVDIVVPTAGSNTAPYIAVEVYFGTNRMQEGDGSYSEGVWSSELRYGLAEVSIPDAHRPGELERPVWWKLQFREDPRRHVVLRDVSDLQQEPFYAALSSSMERSATKDVFLFVHGFNVELDDALRRTAQLAYDLRLPSVPVSFTWPSKGDGAFTYTTAENNALKSVDHFKQFLTEIRERSGSNSINVLAHSMGNRIVVDALHQFAESESDMSLKHVLLAAPDIDAELFRNEIEPALAVPETTTMYSSAKDKALALSEDVHGARRAGSLPIVIRGMDTVDSSNLDLDVLGHSYYADELLQDLYYIIHHGLRASERNLLQHRNDEGFYWSLPR